jgi:polyphosphate kinase
MPRNLDRRIELLVPIEDAQCRQRLTHILETCFADNVKARRLLGDGTHERVTAAGEVVRAQERLFDEVRAAVKQAEQQRATVFEPHLPGRT